MNTSGAMVFFLLVLILKSATVVASDEPAVPQSFQDLQKQLSDTHSLAGDFTQIRELKLLSKPLVSRGSIYYRKTAGICWQLATPVAASVYLTKDKVSVSDAASSNTLATSNPVLQAFSNLLFAVFRGDLAALERQFDVAMSFENTHWQLMLHPKSSLMKNVAESVAVTGGNSIDTVQLFHPDGDKTTLNFDDIQLNPPSVPSGLKCNDADQPS